MLVNNAGITGFEDAPGPHDPENASLDDWCAVFATNLGGVFLGCKHGIRADHCGTRLPGRFDSSSESPSSNRA